MLRFLVVIALLFAIPVFAEDAKQYAVMGAKKCKVCHSTEKQAGTHYKIWEQSAHAKAFQTLLSDQAKESAKKHGIEDPSKDERCLSCHVTKGAAAELHADGISCEACHGPAEGYLKPHAKEGYEVAIANGMIDTKNMTPEKIAETCVVCHKEDPLNDFHKPFNFDEYWPKVDHKAATAKKE